MGMEVSGNSSNIAPAQSTQRTPPPPPPPQETSSGGYDNPSQALRSRDKGSSNNSLLSWVAGVFDKLKGSVFGMAGAVVGGRGGESQEK